MAPAATVQRPHLVRLVAIVVLAIIILTSLIVIIIWLAIQPNHKLKYSMEKVSIRGYNLSVDSGYVGHLNASFRFLIRSYNPNTKVDFFYDKVNVTVMQETEDVIVKKLDPFWQRRRNVTYLDLNLFVNDFKVVDVASRERMQSQKASEQLELMVIIKGKIKLRCGVFIKVRRTLEVTCGVFQVPFRKNFEGEPCEVHISQ